MRCREHRRQPEVPADRAARSTTSWARRSTATRPRTRRSPNATDKAEQILVPLNPAGARTGRTTARQSRPGPWPGPSPRAREERPWQRRRHPHAHARPRSAGVAGATCASTLWRMRREWSAYLFLAPGVILFSVFTLVRADLRVLPDVPRVEHHPAGTSRSSGCRTTATWSTTSTSATSIINTFYYTGGSVPLTMLIGLGAGAAAQPADQVPRRCSGRSTTCRSSPRSWRRRSSGSGSTTATTACSTTTCSRRT